ncbi:MAG: PIN domain-containing protein [Candidatus Binatia bacterium]
MIDSSLLVAAERGVIDLRSLLEVHGDEEVALAAVTASELLHGVHRAPRGKKRTDREAFVEHLLAQIPVVAFDLLAARTHARVWAQLAARGAMVGERDLLIAATAMSRGFAVATRDARSFPRIPGLSVLNW